MLKNAKDLVQLLEVLLVPERLEEQGQVISIPFSHCLEVLLGGPRGDVLGGEELEQEDLDSEHKKVTRYRVALPAASLEICYVSKAAID